MSGAIGNLRTGGLGRSAVFILGAVVCTVSLSGVVAPPALRIGQAEELLRAAHSRAEHFESQQQALEELRAEGALEGVARASEILTGTLPHGQSEIELHSITRLAARSAGIELASVGVGETESLDLPVYDEVVMMRTVEISGTATVPSVVEFVERLAELGYPNTVLEVGLSRVKASEKRFDLRMELGLFHLAPRPVARGLEGFETTEEDLP